MSEMVLAVVAILLFAVLMSRTVFIQNEIYRPLEEGERGPHLRRLRMWYYLFFWGGALVAIVGSLAQITWFREIGMWMWIASLPLFVVRQVEFRRYFRQRRKHE
jgi:hypothetical protein